MARESNRPSQVGSVLGFISVLIMGFPGIFQPLVGYLMAWGHHFHQAHGMLVYSRLAYQMGLLPLIMALVFSIVCALCLPETFGNEVKE